MNLLTLFGLFAVSSMLICYAFEKRSTWFILGFSVACALGSAYGFLQGAWPFGVVEGIWSVVALQRWWRAVRRRVRPPVLPLLLLAGCHFFVPDTRTAEDFAREVAPRCQGFTEEAAAPLLSPASIDAVEPAYSYVQSGPADRQARLRGARIHLRPIAALSRESIARSLECHESRVLLGAAPPPADDPYAHPGRWLDIDVDSERDGFVVRVQTDDLATAKDVLERAKRHASLRRTP